MDFDGFSKQVLVYAGTGDPEDLWVGFTDDVTFNEAVHVMNALAHLADERGLWVYVVNEWHTGLLVWSQKNADVWEPGFGLQALNELPGFWTIVRTAPIDGVVEFELVAPLLLGIDGVADDVLDSGGLRYR